MQSDQSPVEIHVPMRTQLAPQERPQRFHGWHTSCPNQREAMSYGMDNNVYQRRRQLCGHILGETVGGAMAVLCVVSTLVLAQGQTLVCMKVDDRGNCIEAKG